MGKRGRKPSEYKKGYFYEKEEEAVVSYINSESAEEKPRTVRASRGLLHGRRVPGEGTARGRGAHSGAGSAVAGVALGCRGRAADGGVPGAARDRAGACVRRAAGLIRGPGGAVVPDTRGALQPAGASRSFARGDAASAADHGPDRRRNRGEFTRGGAGTGRGRRCAGIDGAAGLQRAGYQRVPPGRGSGGAAMGRGGGGGRDGVCAAAGEGVAHADGGISEGQGAPARGEAGDCGERADAGGVRGGQRWELPLPAGGGECGAVAAGDGYFRAAFALGSAVEFADGSDGVRLLPGGVAYRRESGTGEGWGDGAAVSGGGCGGAGGAVGALVGRSRVPPGVGGEGGTADAGAFHAGASGTGDGGDLPGVSGAGGVSERRMSHSGSRGRRVDQRHLQDGTRRILTLKTSGSEPCQGRHVVAERKTMEPDLTQQRHHAHAFLASPARRSVVRGLRPAGKHALSP